MSGILGNAITGINAAQLGLVTTEHNISNANTPGYTRQRIIQGTNPPVFSGSGFIGQGTRVATIERQYSAFLTTQFNQSQANASELSKYYDEIAEIDNVLADPATGLSPAVQDFFRGVQQVASDPSSLPARQSMVSSAEALTARFQSINSRFSELYDSVNEGVRTAIDNINSQASQIAELNQRILVSGASTGQSPNDLLDQRDQLISELSKNVRVSVVADTNGSYNVFIGSGQQLVVGSVVNQFVTTTSPSDASRLAIALQSSVGVTPLSDAAFTGGELGGLLRFRSETLDSASNSLGQVAASFASTFNAQHALGQDLLGQAAGSSGFAADFFSLPTSFQAIGNAKNTSGTFVNVSYVAPTAGSNGFTSALTTSDYSLVSNGGGNYTLTRLSDKKAWGPAPLGNAGAPFAAGSLNSILSNPADPAFDPQGFTLSATGAAATNESFLIQPTRNAAGNISVNSAVAADVRLIAAAAPIRVQPASTNVGSGKVTSSSVGAGYVAPGAGSPLTLTFAGPAAGFPNGSLTGFPVGTQVTLTNAGALNGTYAIGAPGTQVPYQSGATIQIDDPATPPALANALQLQIAGIPTGGDSFVIQRNGQGVSDGRNMLALGQLQSQNTMNGGTATYQSSYARLVSDVGNRSRETKVTRDAQLSQLEQVSAARESESGVNLDEEAANLLRYQQAYQASAKSLDIAGRLFDEILSLGR